jgi:hypothetical protein
VLVSVVQQLKHRRLIPSVSFVAASSVCTIVIGGPPPPLLPLTGALALPPAPPGFVYDGYVPPAPAALPYPAPA